MALGKFWRFLALMPVSFHVLLNPWREAFNAYENIVRFWKEMWFNAYENIAWFWSEPVGNP
jgi:hypothetical protein